MKHIYPFLKLSCTLLLLLAAVLFMTSNAIADAIATGDVTPTSDPTQWSSTVYIGDTGTGTLAITDGTSVYGNRTYLGFQTGADGTVTVAGESDWNPLGLVVGYAGTGTVSVTDSTLNVQGPAFIGCNPDGAGTVRVAGEGAALNMDGILYTGHYGTGSLSITNGASALWNDYTYLGYHADSIGTVTVDGNESSLSFGKNIYVGYGGTGSLVVTNGGSVQYDNNSSIYLGYNADSTGTITVDGTGTTLESNSSLTVGNYGTGELAVTNGGSVVTTRSVFIGSYEGSSGTVSVSGTDATLEAYQLTVGLRGSGTLNISDKGTISATGITYVYDQGNIAVDTGGILNTGTLYAGFSQLSGTGTINTSGIVTSGVDLVFDSTHGTSQSLTKDGLTVNLSLDDTSDLGVGYGGEGSLTIKDGLTVNSADGYLGYCNLFGGNDTDLDAIGTATVDGDGTTWNTDSLYVGYSGTGTLSITNGASVTTSEYAFLSYKSGTSGTAIVDGEGSTWDTGSRLYVGMSDKGELSITNGGSVTSQISYIGYQYGTGNGIVNVDGEGSTWDAGTLWIASIGSMLSGRLSITNGGLVTSDITYLGRNNGTTGIVSVNGEGSTWNNLSSLYLGYVSGTVNTPVLSISDGGLVTTENVSLVTSDAILTVDVNSNFKVGTTDNNWSGTIKNNGTIRLVAGAGADAGAYEPISYGTMKSITGAVQTLGGIWDEDAHTITVAEAATNESGSSSVTFDLAENQRALITNSNGVSVGAAFLGTDISTSVTFTAAAVTGENLTTLENLISGTDDSLLSIWDFSTTGYEAGSDSPVYLSLAAALASDILDLSIWFLAEDGWAEYDAYDLAFDGTYASFTVEELGIYAVTADLTASVTGGNSAVPVPGTGLLLGAGLLGLAGVCRRKK